MTDTIEDWAKIAAYREAYPLGEYGDPAIIADWPHMNCAIHALARRIQRDDKPPVDPLLLEARKLAGVFWRSQGQHANAGNAENGRSDEGPTVQAAYKYLKEKQNG